MQRLKTRILLMLQANPYLYSLAYRSYYRLVDRSFRTLSRGSPDALQKVFDAAGQPGLIGGAGDYYEFGLFRGYTLWCSYQNAQTSGFDDMHFYGFDSFAGLPPVEGIDRSHNWFFEGQFAAAKTEVARNLDQRGVDRDKVTLVEGFFNDSLTPELKQQHPFKPVSVAMIDVDLYSSTCEVLSWLQDFLVSGSIVIFDDWFAYGDGDELGQPRAFQDFLEANPHLTSEPLLEYEPNGKAFVLRAA